MSFDLLAPHYSWMESVLAGDKLQRCRTVFLKQLPEIENILLAGEGHGHGLAACCARFGNARITVVDASASMLSQAKRALKSRSGDPGNVRFVQADILEWSSPPLFDLIVTNFFLDCFRPDQLEPVIGSLARAAKPGAHWLLADFQAAGRGLRRLRSQLILWSMYRFFRVATRLPAKYLTPPDPWLKQAGFVLNQRVESEWGLLHSDWWEKLLAPN